MSLLDTLTPQIDRYLDALSQPIGIVAVVSAVLAGLLVAISAFVKTMIPLRWLAVGSNVGFIVYGLTYPSTIMVVLHAVLLPVNLVRVGQMVRLTRRATAVAGPKQMELWLRPYMRSRHVREGTTLFRIGDPATRLYFLVDGRVELPEVGRTMESGQVFGEIAFVAPGRRRTSSARCLTPCTVMFIDEATFRQLVYQNPGFGLQIMQLIAGRLSDDVRRLSEAGSET